MIPRIAIAGGGPGGLCLARILHRANIRSTVYEAERDANQRGRQGGMLDLHAETGLLAMKECGLLDEFHKKVIAGGEQMVILDSQGRVHFDSGAGEDHGRPEIERGDLRAILLDSLPADTIKWNHKLRAVEATGDTYRLRFDNAAEEEADIVIGADGAWSKVRALLTPTKPIYAGVTFVEYALPVDVASSPRTLDLFGGGTSMVVGNKRSLILQRGQRTTRVYACLQVPEDWNEKHLLSEDANEVQGLLKDYFNEGWSEAMRSYLKPGAVQPAVHRPLYALPDNYEWPAVVHKGVTLLGDAAHVATPNGEGVNLALRDAVDLGQAIIAAGNAEALNAGLRKYEQVMWDRSQKEKKDGAELFDVVFNSNGPETLAGWMKSMSPDT